MDLLRVIRPVCNIRTLNDQEKIQLKISSQQYKPRKIYYCETVALVRRYKSYTEIILVNITHKIVVSQHRVSEDLRLSGY